MEWLLLAVVVIGLFFGLTVFWGAPYVPAHKTDVTVAFGLLNLKPGDLLVDLGSGDGVVLREAANRGLRAYGYEINPLLCLASRWRCRQHGNKVHIFWRDFWLADLPEDTKGVFVFAGGPFMKRLAKKLQNDANKLGRPLMVVSYGFGLPGYEPVAKASGMQLFIVNPK